MARLLQQNQDLKFKHSILEKVVAVSMGRWAAILGAAQEVLEPSEGDRPDGDPAAQCVHWLLAFAAPKAPLCCAQ